jgi:hypothetical protein
MPWVSGQKSGLQKAFELVEAEQKGHQMSASEVSEMDTTTEANQ